ncbi:Dbl homology domain-containing protein [Pterulicium gracile]|uniref:Dbl homology domain-containing protein n=1 Tax=Pterulicium gracile TaxID=1884261 RepID=A0A5C3Q980_9AGAR|nr:Dbl homology domain-containing protein [Pterula gracilis]
MDTQRRQVLQELCTTEEHFIARLEGTIRLYVLPLRVESTRTWITGVPPDFAKLLDWFEDIMHLHRFMVTSLRSRLVDHESRHGASFRGGDETVAELLGKFIHRLEVYQPYLVQLSGVVDLVGKMVDDGSNDLGQFIQMQQKAGGGGDELQQMLVEPVDMLSKYPDIFRVSD